LRFSFLFKPAGRNRFMKSKRDRGR